MLKSYSFKLLLAIAAAPLVLALWYPIDVAAATSQYILEEDGAGGSALDPGRLAQLSLGLEIGREDRFVGLGPIRPPDQCG